MKVRFVWIDRTKNSPEKLIIDDYVRRIKRFADTEIIELKSSGRQDNPDAAMDDEAKEIEKHIPPGAFLVTTSPGKNEISSVEFAELIKDVLKVQARQIVIIVGGRYGLAKRILGKSDFILSLSRMTLNHYLVRIFLLEQVYRAFCIMENLPYAR